MCELEIRIMKSFTKIETISLAAIFLILIAVAVPNFIVSMMKSRDQIRRDDMGSINHALDAYLADFENLPVSSPDGRIMACLKSGDVPHKDKTGKMVFDYLPCDWGKDAFVNQFTGRVYLPILPNDPNYQKGVKYLYLSDGNRFQVFASEENRKEVEIDPKIVARNLSCGSRICNMGRSYNVPTDISIEEYDKLLLNGK